jgi:ribosomal protein S6--L-glutamate ligase
MKSDNPPLIIRDSRSFRNHLPDLRRNDLLVGQMNLKSTEETLFLYLVEQGVQFFPSALSQQLSRSKCLQTFIYADLMVPHTFVARGKYDMIRNIARYGREEIGPVITKQNRTNCGLGISRWPSIEDVYNQVCFGSLQYPFVVQPFLTSFTDLRIIILADYEEVYCRKNLNSFRNNVLFGGSSQACVFAKKQKDMCAGVMAKGGFPYAHIDLMITPENDIYFSEINLRGGLKGAVITEQEYWQRIERIQEEFIEEYKLSVKFSASS